MRGHPNRADEPVIRRTLGRYLAARRNPWIEAVEAVGLAFVLAAVLRAALFQAFYIPSSSMSETLRPWDHILVEKISYRGRAPRRGEIVVFDFGSAPPPPLLRVAPLHAALGSGGGEEPGGSASEEPREFVKRVIAVEGDVIEARGTKLYVNGGEIPGVRSSDNSPAFVFRIPGNRARATNRGIEIDGEPLESALPDDLPPESLAAVTARDFVRLGRGGLGVLRAEVPKGMLYVMGDNREESIDSRYFGFVAAANVRGKALLTYWPLERWRLL